MWGFNKAHKGGVLDISIPPVTELEDKQAQEVLKDFLTDAVKVRVYQLEQMATRNVMAESERLAAYRRDVNASIVEMRQEVEEVKTRSRRYRKQLGHLNAAHRLLKLEYKELKNKYDSALRAQSATQQATLDNPGHTTTSGGAD